MKAIHSALLTAAMCALSPMAQAESLRCNGQFTEVGDSRLSVLYKCGEPVLKDSFCAAVYTALSVEPVPAPFAASVLPCLRVDEWLYDRGPGQMMATVRFQFGVVQAIRYGRMPQ